MRAGRTRLRTIAWRGAASDEAAPLVLVHGLSCSHRYFMPLARQLAPYFPVYIPDLPGFGDSEKPRRALDIPGLSAALADWMAALGVRRAAFVANSLGCQIVAELALRRPDLVERAVFVGPTMDPAAPTVWQQGLRLARDMFREPLALWAILLRDYLAAGPRRTLLTARFAVQDRIEQRLPRIAAPVLIVRGEHDPIVPQAWAEQTARLLPHGRLAVIPGAPHDAHFSRPAYLTYKVLLPFLAASTCERKGAAESLHPR